MRITPRVQLSSLLLNGQAEDRAKQMASSLFIRIVLPYYHLGPSPPQLYSRFRVLYGAGRNSCSVFGARRIDLWLWSKQTSGDHRVFAGDEK